MTPPSSPRRHDPLCVQPPAVAPPSSISRAAMPNTPCSPVRIVSGRCPIARRVGSMMIYLRPMETLTPIKEPYGLLIQMPVMDGSEATARIREAEKGCGVHTPIIALTAHKKGEEIQKMIQAGVDAYITKPLNKDNFLTAFSQLIRL
ncbi:hypothetical protein ACS0TY_024482 [Phlomoides rotata]